MVDLRLGLQRWPRTMIVLARGSLSDALTIGFGCLNAGWQERAGALCEFRSMRRSASQCRAAPAMAPPQSPGVVGAMMRFCRVQTLRMEMIEI